MHYVVIMSEQPKPELGMGVTQQLIADRYPYQVVGIINHRRIVVQGQGTTKTVHLTLRGDGKWKRHGTDGRGEHWNLGKAESYYCREF